MAACIIGMGMEKKRPLAPVLVALGPAAFFERCLARCGEASPVGGGMAVREGGWESRASKKRSSFMDLPPKQRRVTGGGGVRVKNALHHVCSVSVRVRLPLSYEWCHLSCGIAVGVYGTVSPCVCVRSSGTVSTQPCVRDRDRDHNTHHPPSTMQHAAHLSLLGCHGSILAAHGTRPSTSLAEPFTQMMRASSKGQSAPAGPSFLPLSGSSWHERSVTMRISAQDLAPRSLRPTLSGVLPRVSFPFLARE